MTIKKYFFNELFYRKLLPMLYSVINAEKVEFHQHH